MRLFYTGATALDRPQENPNISLGGFKSSTVIPNGRKNALFSDIDYVQKHEGLFDIRGVVLKNETGAQVANITLYFDPDPNPTATYEIIAVTVAANGSMESINDGKSLPYVGTFVSATGVANKVTLATTLADKGLIGLWVKRTIVKQNHATCEELEAQTTPDPTLEELKIVIEFI